MTVSSAPGALKKLVRARGPHQCTFRTPLPPGDFVRVVLEACGAVSGGTLVIEDWALEPAHLAELVSKVSGVVAPSLARDTVIVAESREETSTLLEAALSDWVDFYFAPTPKPVVLYADHDEYCTFFASGKSGVNRVAAPLREAGFYEVEGYIRK